MNEEPEIEEELVRRMMNEELEYEEELVRLSTILETLKKDALEVSTLIVRGIEFYRVIGYVLLALGVFSLWYIWQHINAGDVIMSGFWVFLGAVCLIAGPYSLYANRRLGKKYKELISIQKSLMEE